MKSIISGLNTVLWSVVIFILLSFVFVPKAPPQDFIDIPLPEIEKPKRPAALASGHITMASSKEEIFQAFKQVRKEYLDLEIKHVKTQVQLVEVSEKLKKYVAEFHLQTVLVNRVWSLAMGIPYPYDKPMALERMYKKYESIMTPKMIDEFEERYFTLDKLNISVKREEK